MNITLIDETSFGHAAITFLQDFKSRDNMSKGVKECFAQLKPVECYDDYSAKCWNCGRIHWAHNLILCSGCYANKCVNCTALNIVPTELCENITNHHTH